MLKKRLQGATRASLDTVKKPPSDSWEGRLSSQRTARNEREEEEATWSAQHQSHENTVHCSQFTFFPGRPGEEITGCSQGATNSSQDTVWLYLRHMTKSSMIQLI